MQRNNFNKEYLPNRLSNFQKRRFWHTIFIWTHTYMTAKYKRQHIKILKLYYNKYFFLVAGVYTFVKKIKYSPTPFRKSWLSFFYSNRVIFALIFPYFANILPFYSLFPSFLSPFFFLLHFPLFLFTLFILFRPDDISSYYPPPPQRGRVFLIYRPLFGGLLKPTWKQDLQKFLGETKFVSLETRKNEKNEFSSFSSI